MLVCVCVWFLQAIRGGHQQPEAVNSFETASLRRRRRRTKKEGKKEERRGETSRWHGDTLDAAIMKGIVFW